VGGLNDDARSLVHQTGRGPVELGHDVVDEERTQLRVGTGDAGQQAVDGLHTESTDQGTTGHHRDVSSDPRHMNRDKDKHVRTSDEQGTSCQCHMKPSQPITGSSGYSLIFRHFQLEN